MWKDFKAFMMRGNVVDLAVAVVIGAAFGGIVKSMVDDVIMPPLGLVVGRVDFSKLMLVLKAGNTPGKEYATPAAATADGAVTLNYGAFINNVIAFLIVGFAVFLLIRMVNRFGSKPAPAAPNTKPCLECTMSIPLAAKRCPHCTAVVA